MKSIVLFTLLFSVVSAQAASKTLYCTKAPLKFESGNFDSFTLKVTAQSVVMSKMTFSQEFVGALAKNADYYKDQITKETDPTTKANDQKYMSMYQKLVKLAAKGLTMKGALLPYKDKTDDKGDKVRFDIKPATKGWENLFDHLDYEIDSAKLFITLSKGKINPSPIWIEYDGSQGPYYDHFTCK